MLINEQRLMERINSIGEIGKTENGISRVAFSKEYFQGVSKLKEKMEEENLIIRIDKLGNIFGRRNGTLENASTILIGSHMDTVKDGGLYDGNMGVVAALECISILNENNINTKHNIEIVGFNAEEGGELGGTFGSRVAIGEQKLDISNIDKKLEIYNLTKEDIIKSKIDYNLKCFIELHIEQGINLYQSKKNIGIVEGIVGITRYKITIMGEANHAGTTPMNYRKDALVAASQIIIYINEVAKQMPQPFVATVGRIENQPNSVNVIPGEVNLVLEIREMKKNVIIDFINKIKTKTEAMNDYDIEFNIYSDKKSEVLDENLSNIVEKICKGEKLSYSRMYSGAGHDAMELTKIVPTALIFIPSKDGISHSKMEYSEEKDIVNGVNVLLKSILEIDKL